MLVSKVISIAQWDAIRAFFSLFTHSPLAGWQQQQQQQPLMGSPGTAQPPWALPGARPKAEIPLALLGAGTQEGQNRQGGVCVKRSVLRHDPLRFGHWQEEAHVGRLGCPLASQLWQNKLPGFIYLFWGGGRRRWAAAGIPVPSPCQLYKLSKRLVSHRAGSCNSCPGK